MNNYQKIAVIVLRTSALTLMFSGLLEWAIMSAGVLLISLEVFEKDTIAYETLSLASFFYFIGGFILFARSKSLVSYIVDGLEDDNKSASQD